MYITATVVDTRLRDDWNSALVIVFAGNILAMSISKIDKIRKSHAMRSHVLNQDVKVSLKISIDKRLCPPPIFQYQVFVPSSNRLKETARDNLAR
jgi:hypothetical protein